MLMPRLLYTMTCMCLATRFTPNHTHTLASDDCHACLGWGRIKQANSRAISWLWLLQTLCTV